MKMRRPEGVLYTVATLATIGAITVGCAAPGGPAPAESPTPPTSAPANPTGGEATATRPEATRAVTPEPKPSPTAVPVDIRAGGTSLTSPITADDMAILKGNFGDCAAIVGSSGILGDNSVVLGMVPPDVNVGDSSYKLQYAPTTGSAVYVNGTGDKQVVFGTTVGADRARSFLPTGAVVCKQDGMDVVVFRDGNKNWRVNNPVKWQAVEVPAGHVASYDNEGNLQLKNISGKLVAVFVDDPNDPEYGWDYSFMAEPTRAPEPTKAAPPSPTAPAPKPTDVLKLPTVVPGVTRVAPATATSVPKPDAGQIGELGLGTIKGAEAVVGKVTYASMLTSGGEVIEVANPTENDLIQAGKPLFTFFSGEKTLYDFRVGVDSPQAKVLAGLLGAVVSNFPGLNGYRYEFIYVDKISSGKVHNFQAQAWCSERDDQRKLIRIMIAPTGGEQFETPEFVQKTYSGTTFSALVAELAYQTGSLPTQKNGEHVYGAMTNEDQAYIIGIANVAKAAVTLPNGGIRALFTVGL